MSDSRADITPVVQSNVFSAGLHCAMQINNKSICLKYRVNIFLAFICAVIAGGITKEKKRKS